MGRMIDADKLKERVEYINSEYGHIYDEIDNMPTIEPERKRGKWIINKYGYVVCSECKYNAPRIMTGCLANRHLDYDKSDYCWHCGAKMVEPQESEDKE